MFLKKKKLTKGGGRGAILWDVLLCLRFPPGRNKQMITVRLAGSSNIKLGYIVMVYI